MKKISKSLILSSLSLGILSSLSLTHLPVKAQVNSNYQSTAQVTYQSINAENNIFKDVNTQEFILKHHEWFDIQAYVEGALSLPTTEASMKSNFRIPDEEAFERFQPLLEQYISVYDSAYFWKNDLYPSIVNLSLTLSNFGDIKHIMMQPLVASLQVMIDKAFSPLPSDIQEVEQNRKQAIAYLNSLLSFSTRYAQDASVIETDLFNYSTDLEVQLTKLNRLKADHSEFLCDDGSSLVQEIDNINSRILQLNEKYEHYVIVASTAVTYYWAPLASIPVMAIFGHRAEEVRKERNRLYAELNELDSQLDYHQRVYNSYTRSTKSISGMIDKIYAATPHVNQFKLDWQRLTVDFNSLLLALNSAETSASLADNNTFINAVTAMANTQVAEQNWNDIISRAESFANSAYILRSE